MKRLTSHPILTHLAEIWMRFTSIITGRSRANKNITPPGTSHHQEATRKHPCMKNNFTACYNDILIRTSKSI